MFVEDANGTQVVFTNGSSSAGMICSGSCVAPQLTNPGNSSVCQGLEYTFPTPLGTNLQSPTYYTGSGGTGTPYAEGESITVNGDLMLYLYDASGSCSDEEMFTVTMIPTPVISIISGPACAPDLLTYAVTVMVTGGS